MDATTECPACGRALAYQRFHAGFGNQGFMYGATGSVVLTWDTADPVYMRIVDAHPWMLSADQQQEVERAVRRGLEGEPFHFANPPLCRHCGEPLPALLDPAREYFVIMARRIDAENEQIWR